MSGETNLTVLLKLMNPILHDEEYIFCSVDRQDHSYLKLDPICIFHEDEGLTLIVQRDRADAAEISYSSVFRMVTLSVHSSLDAVGFLATITNKLAKHGISVNPISAYYHDHLFVPSARAGEVMKLLRDFSTDRSNM
ncbi:ACT domain-containing protein [Gloeocapsopsis sp. IPPAS B-1203]|uniref:ACT domain-containing protein n=1 Tax=Gloeocapsopsis sp. IPPAS B-1203 TaxID=2049454 RepID=UPI000C198F62|nr:ACT domain-containing protein [Gloeocapsopsis sp. IPPAS B-1203]PIG91710.1 transporter [Gloeocapsopsis sp. IPPAS B-1203]